MNTARMINRMVAFKQYACRRERAGIFYALPTLHDKTAEEEEHVI